MRITLIVLGVLLMFFGTVWFFQGINVLPGSFMTGQTQWAVYGGIAFAVGSLFCIGPGASALLHTLRNLPGLTNAHARRRNCPSPQRSRRIG
jgi:hypothetical protein